MMHYIAKVSKIPGPSALHILRNMRMVQNQTHVFLHKLAEQYGEICQCNFGNRSFILINHPDFIQYVFKTNHQNYLKSKNYRELKHLLGEGLLTSEKEKWRKNRRLIQPVFHHQNMARLVPTMIECIIQRIERWRKQPETLVDIHKEMNALALSIISKTLFSVDISDQSTMIGKALGRALDATNRRTIDLVRFPMSIPTPLNLKLRRNKKILNDIVRSIIQGRRSQKEEHIDLLSLLLGAKDDERIQLNDDEILDECMTIFLAGHETTANALTWAFLLLSNHPDIQEELVQEIQAQYHTREEPRNLQDQYPKNYQVFLETLRLYPPAWIIERQTIEADQIGPYLIPPGINIFLSPWVTHRSEQFWPDANAFKPERFNHPKEIAPYHYFPFGGGPRICIGQNFATMEALLIMTMVLKEFQMVIQKNQMIQATPRVTLRPNRPVMMHLIPRN